MPSCVVKSCKNRSQSNKKIDGITFHLFPTKLESRLKWIAAIRYSRNEPTWQPSSKSVVCSDHFEVGDLYRTSKDFRRVKRESYPTKALGGTATTVLICGSQHNQKDPIKLEIESEDDVMYPEVLLTQEKSAPSSSINPAIHSLLDTQNIADENVSTMTVFSHNLPAAENVEDKVLESRSIVFSHNLPSPLCADNTNKDNTNISSSSSSEDENMPHSMEIKETQHKNAAELLSIILLKDEVKKLQNKIINYKKKNKCLNQKVRRLKAMNTRLNELLKNPSIDLDDK